MKGTWTATGMNREFPKVKIEKKVKMQPPRKYGMTDYFYDQIASMAVGDSFQIEARYSVSALVRGAFVKRNWKSQMICQGKNKDGQFIMRFWRIK